VHVAFDLRDRAFQHVVTSPRQVDASILAYAPSEPQPLPVR
jgi:hypothetical protein